MNLLFVSGTTVGGSGRSQRELARGLVRLGHRVDFLVDDGRQARVVRSAYGQLSDLAARLESTPLRDFAAWAESLVGRTTGTLDLDDVRHLTTPIPQNALSRALDVTRPDIVVCNSVERLTWRRVHRLLEARGIPSVLYVREVESLDHLSTGAVPTALVANAESLQRSLVERGHECSFVPSLIDVGVTRTESTRRVALSINPAVSRGGDFVWELAARCPEIPFVVQESWPLSGAELADVIARAGALANVEFRRSAPPGPRLYGDARVLLVPYRVDNRPRVIAEAQANGIPVLAADVPALAEAIGHGGRTLPLDDVETWAAALRAAWVDTVDYEQMSNAALEHSTRAEIDPDRVAAAFATIAEEAVVRGGRHDGTTRPRRSTGWVLRHSRSGDFEEALAQPVSQMRSVSHWTDLADDPNDPAAVTYRARTLASAWRPPVADRVRFVEERCGGRRVLDIGCVAHSAERMRQPNWLHGRIASVASACIGVDVLPEAVDFMNRSGYRVIAHDVTKGVGPLAELGPFEVIVAGELIEHVPAQDALFGLAKELLAPGGQLIVTTPNPYAPHRVRAGQLGIVWENVDHITYAFPSGVAELCDRHGLELAEACVTHDAHVTLIRSPARRLKRWIRGSGWRNVGVTTMAAPRQVAVDFGPLGRIAHGLSWPDRRFVGETFIYVIRRPG